MAQRAAELPAHRALLLVGLVHGIRLQHLLEFGFLLWRQPRLQGRLLLTICRISNVYNFTMTCTAQPQSLLQQQLKSANAQVLIDSHSAAAFPDTATFEVGWRNTEHGGEQCRDFSIHECVLADLPQPAACSGRLRRCTCGMAAQYHLHLPQRPAYHSTTLQIVNFVT